MQKGDTDVEIFEIMMKHMKAAEKEAEEVLEARRKNAEVLQEDDSSDEEDARDVEEVQREGAGVQSDGEVLRRNKYRASGSCARYSDSEINKIKAPVVKKVPGCPRSKRFVGGYEMSKKWKKKTSKKKTRSALVGNCDANITGNQENETNDAPVENSDKVNALQDSSGTVNGKHYIC